MQPVGRPSHPELVRRFLADPARAPTRTATARRVHDRYLDGTRLRLRTEYDERGRVVAHRLGRKTQLPGSEPVTAALSELVLDADDAAVLGRLHGRDLAKLRHAVDAETGVVVIDVFTGPLEGLCIAEVRFDTTDELEAYEPPDWTGREVTHDAAFGDAALADMDASHLATLLV
jgi:CYTH domain-containing protein